MIHRSIHHKQKINKNKKEERIALTVLLLIFRLHIRETFIRILYTFIYILILILDFTDLILSFN